MAENGFSVLRFVVEEEAATVGRDENVGFAVVVIIAHGNPLRILAVHVQPRAAADVLKRAIPFVAIEEKVLLFLGAWEVAARDEENILKSIAVIIQKGTAAAQRLKEEIFLRRTVGVAEREASAFGDVLENAGFLWTSA